MAGKMKTQRQRVQVAKGLQSDRAHRALGDLGEQVFTQLGERGGRQAQNSIGKEQRNRQDQHLSRGRKRQAVDDALEYQRHADVGQLGRDQAGECEHHSAPIGKEVRQERAHRLPIAAESAIRRSWKGKR